MADWTPQSRAEEILFDTINGEPYDGLPQSRIEELLLELKDAIESGGGGGGGAYTTTVLFTNGASGDTTFQLSSAYTNFDAIAIYYSHFDGQDSYEDVRTYPTTFLNSVSSTDEVLGLTNDAWYYYFSVYSTTEFRYVKSNAGYITDIIGIKYGSNSGGGGGGGTDNYNLLKNLPQINGQTVKGNMSGTTLGLVNMVMGKDLSTNDYTNADKAIVDSVTADLADKVDKVSGKGLSTNDFTDAYKEKVDTSKSEFIGTMAQWNALTTAEKKAFDTYQITDDNSEALMPNYSTTEQKTGQKWIDGKDIYVKTFATPISITANDQWIAIGLNGIDSLIDYTIRLTRDNEQVGSSFNSGFINVVVRDNTLNVKGHNMTITDLYAISSMTVYYTKTT